mmetsp:Transcript_18938/g.50738  ORF Transcript_18938/g.50738 Transcript_18938/m.50738 type:complete len:97 (-) Transcript_18938:91-381(-)
MKMDRSPPRWSWWSSLSSWLLWSREVCFHSRSNLRRRSDKGRSGWNFHRTPDSTDCHHRKRRFRGRLAAVAREQQSWSMAEMQDGVGLADGEGEED